MAKYIVLACMISFLLNGCSQSNVSSSEKPQSPVSEQSQEHTEISTGDEGENQQMKANLGELLRKEAELQNEGADGQEVSGQGEETAPISGTSPEGTESGSGKTEEVAASPQEVGIGSEELLLSGRVICIDPGHCITPLVGKGYTSPVSPLSKEEKPLYTAGAEGTHITEEKLNLLVGLKLRDALELLGAKVLMTREVSEITITGLERCEIANKNGADVNIHIHADGVDDSRAHGVSVLVPGGDLLGTPSIAEESVRLGKIMVDCVAEATGAKNRGTTTRADLTGFNFSEVPSVMIEMGFLSNPEEEAKLATEEYQDKIVEGMVTSLLKWYGL